MTRRRLAVTAALTAAALGEWLGHGIAYFRTAGLAGLAAGLSGIHAYMLPLGAVLLLAGATGASLWLRCWHGLGHRLDRAMRSVAALWRGRLRGAERPPRGGGTAVQPAASLLATTAALALVLAAVQVALFVAQENAERAVHGLPLPGFAPLLASAGAATWIQAAVALLFAVLLAPLFRAFEQRLRAARRLERIARALVDRLARAAVSPSPVVPALRAAHLRSGTVLWRGPPLVTAPA